jgi:CBS domain-containing protein
MVTDRDIVIRCLAADKHPGDTKIEDIMTHGVVSVRPDMETSQVAALNTAVANT